MAQKTYRKDRLLRTTRAIPGMRIRRSGQVISELAVALGCKSTNLDWILVELEKEGAIQKEKYGGYTLYYYPVFEIEFFVK